MGSETDYAEAFGIPGDYVAPDALHLSDIDEDGASMGQEINQRRAQAENAEALRLARAL